MKIMYAIAFLSFLSSCTKEPAQRELDISVKTKSGLVDKITQSKPNFYPNPFANQVSLHVDGSTEYTVTIAGIDGWKKLKLNQSNAMFNFSNEKDGTYYAEVLVNGKVYRYTLIKDAQ